MLDRQMRYGTPPSHWEWGGAPLIGREKADVDLIEYLKMAHEEKGNRRPE
jgi:hypothetical protein